MDSVPEACLENSKSILSFLRKILNHIFHGPESEDRMVIQDETLGDVLFTLNWKTNRIIHRDAYFAHAFNLWQDFLPKTLAKELEGKPKGYKTRLRLDPGHVVPAYSKDQFKTVKSCQLDLSRVPGGESGPGKGRYYPRGILRAMGGIFPQNILPFRFIEEEGEKAKLDFNHPLAGIPLELDIEIQDVKPHDRKYGGSCNDWMDLLLTGPGMQARYEDRPTVFFNAQSFCRADAGPDGHFYAGKRMLSHIDEMAQEVLQGVYGERLKKESVVLDLMASWQSHLPGNLPLARLEGLGMNADEMQANKRLSGFRVQDLNENPELPYETGHFDAVICSLSVEYLIHPFEVFRAVQRVLKSGGLFIVAFSNRWFPTKAIDLWKVLHEFERPALVTEYFLQSGGFENLHTLSQRGYPRPWTDKYYPGILQADPIHAVWGTRV
jgi:SAM-dependent methyltransferase